MQYHPWYIFLIYNGQFKNSKWYTTDTFRTSMYFLLVNVTFYDEVNMIHDVMTTANLFPYTAKFMFDRVRNNKTQQMKRWEIKRIRIYTVVVYQKYLTRLWDMIIFSPRLENYQLSILPTSLDIFAIRQHYIHILCKNHTNKQLDQCNLLTYTSINVRWAGRQQCPLTRNVHSSTHKHHLLIW